MFDLVNDSFFSNFFRDLDSKSVNRWSSLEDKYVLKLNVPGYTEDDIKVKVNVVDHNYTKVSVSGKVNKKDEFGFNVNGSFSVEDYLFNIDEENVSATLKNGQLSLVALKKKTVPKLSESKEVKVLTE